MALADALQNTARKLINTFGNTVQWYQYAEATKSTNDEGDVTVSSWGAGSQIKIIDGNNAKEVLSQSMQGIESLGEDERIIKDENDVLINDRISADSVNYKVVEIRPQRTQDTVVFRVIRVVRVDNIASW